MTERPASATSAASVIEQLNALERTVMKLTEKVNGMAAQLEWINEFLEASNEEEEEEEKGEEERKLTREDTAPEFADDFIGTKAERLQWTLDDYDDFEKQLWPSYDEWTVLSGNKTVSFIKWMEKKFPTHGKSAGLKRAEDKLKRAVDY